MTNRHHTLKNKKVIAGTTGDDNFVYAKGDGSVVIRDVNDKKANDTLSLSDLKLEDVIIVRQGHALKIVVRDTGDVIKIAHQFSGSHGVENLVFADGKTFDTKGISALASANAGLRFLDRFGAVVGDSKANVLVNADKFGLLVGGAGGDTYKIEAGHGNAVIRERTGSKNDTDTLDLSDIKSENVTLSRSGNHLLVKLNETGESIVIENHFAADATAGIEKLVFADKSLDETGIAHVVVNGWSDTTLVTVTGTENADELQATDASERIFALDGDDFVYGGGGNDIIDSGAGLDTIWGGEGNDTFVFAGNSGRDYIIDFTPGQDKVMIGSSLVADGKSVMDYAYQDGKSVIFEFGERVLVLWGKDIADISESMFEVFNDQGGLDGETFTGTSGADRIMGSFGDDTIFGGAGLDEIRGSHGADTFVFKAGSDRDFIVDFNGAHDLLQIDSRLIGAGKTLWDYAYENEGSAVFEFNDTDSIVLWRTTLASLSDSVIELI
jgi:Ca2+-binding RTX toxin-like protein